MEYMFVCRYWNELVFSHKMLFLAVYSIIWSLFPIVSMLNFKLELMASWHSS